MEEEMASSRHFATPKALARTNDHTINHMFDNLGLTQTLNALAILESVDADALSGMTSLGSMVNYFTAPPGRARGFSLGLGLDSMQGSGALVSGGARLESLRSRAQSTAFVSKPASAAGSPGASLDVTPQESRAVSRMVSAKSRRAHDTDSESDAEGPPQTSAAANIVGRVRRDHSMRRRALHARSVRANEDLDGLEGMVDGDSMAELEAKMAALESEDDSDGESPSPRRSKLLQHGLEDSEDHHRRRVEQLYLKREAEARAHRQLRERLRNLQDKEQKARLVAFVETARAATTIQRCWRGFITRRWFRVFIRRAREMQRMQDIDRARREARMRAQRDAERSEKMMNDKFWRNRQREMYTFMDKRARSPRRFSRMRADSSAPGDRGTESPPPSPAAVTGLTPSASLHLEPSTDSAVRLAPVAAGGRPGAGSATVLSVMGKQAGPVGVPLSAGPGTRGRFARPRGPRGPGSSAAGALLVEADRAGAAAGLGTLGASRGASPAPPLDRGPEEARSPRGSLPRGLAPDSSLVGVGVARGAPEGRGRQGRLAGAGPSGSAGVPEEPAPGPDVAVVAVDPEGLGNRAPDRGTRDSFPTPAAPKVKGGGWDTTLMTQGSGSAVSGWEGEAGTPLLGPGSEPSGLAPQPSESGGVTASPVFAGRKASGFGAVTVSGLQKAPKRSGGKAPGDLAAEPGASAARGAADAPDARGGIGLSLEARAVPRQDSPVRQRATAQRLPRQDRPAGQEGEPGAGPAIPAGAAGPPGLHGMGAPIAGPWMAGGATPPPEAPRAEASVGGTRARGRQPVRPLLFGSREVGAASNPRATVVTSPLHLAASRSPGQPRPLSPPRAERDARPASSRGDFGGGGQGRSGHEAPPDVGQAAPYAAEASETADPSAAWDAPAAVVAPIRAVVHIPPPDPRPGRAAEGRDPRTQQDLNVMLFGADHAPELLASIASAVVEARTQSPEGGTERPLEAEASRGVRVPGLHSGSVLDFRRRPQAKRARAPPRDHILSSDAARVTPGQLQRGGLVSLLAAKDAAPTAERPQTREPSPTGRSRSESPARGGERSRLGSPAAGKPVPGADGGIDEFPVSAPPSPPRRGWTPAGPGTAPGLEGPSALSARPLVGAEAPGAPELFRGPKTAADAEGKLPIIRSRSRRRWKRSDRGTEPPKAGGEESLPPGEVAPDPGTKTWGPEGAPWLQVEVSWSKLEGPEDPSAPPRGRGAHPPVSVSGTLLGSVRGKMWENGHRDPVSETARANERLRRSLEEGLGHVPRVPEGTVPELAQELSQQILVAVESGHQIGSQLSVNPMARDDFASAPPAVRDVTRILSGNPPPHALPPPGAHGAGAAPLPPVRSPPPPSPGRQSPSRAGSVGEGPSWAGQAFPGPPEERLHGAQEEECGAVPEVGLVGRPKLRRGRKSPTKPGSTYNREGKRTVAVGSLTPGIYFMAPSAEKRAAKEKGRRVEAKKPPKKSGAGRRSTDWRSAENDIKELIYLRNRPQIVPDDWLAPEFDVHEVGVEARGLGEGVVDFPVA